MAYEWRAPETSQSQTPAKKRVTAEQIKELLASRKARIAELEAENKKLRNELVRFENTPDKVRLLEEENAALRQQVAGAHSRVKETENALRALQTQPSGVVFEGVLESMRVRGQGPVSATLLPEVPAGTGLSLVVTSL